MSTGRTVLAQDWSGTGTGDPGALAIVVEHFVPIDEPSPEALAALGHGLVAVTASGVRMVRLPEDPYRERWYEVTHLDRSTRPLLDQEATLLREWRGRPGSIVVMDAVGLGFGISEQWRQRGWTHTPIMFTSGLDARDLRHVPKGQIVGLLVALAEGGRLTIAPAIPFAEELREELRSFKATVTEHGNLQYAAGTGASDDLVCALAMAVWYLERVPAEIGGLYATI